jgi:hypothetical protein
MQDLASLTLSDAGNRKRGAGRAGAQMNTQDPLDSAGREGEERSARSSGKPSGWTARERRRKLFKLRRALKRALV